MSETPNQTPSDNPTSESLTLGVYLKRAREAKGIQLSDLARENRMSDDYLIAIEDGNYSLLPGDTYVRAYLKSIARRLEIEESKVLNWYLKETKQEKKVELTRNL